MAVPVEPAPDGEVVPEPEEVVAASQAVLPALGLHALAPLVESLAFPVAQAATLVIEAQASSLHTAGEAAASQEQ